MQNFKQYKRIFAIIVFILSFLNIPAYAQENIRVQGKITDIQTGEAIAAVNVIVDGYVVTYSDIDGNYACTVPRDAELIFYSGQYEEAKVKVDNRQVINVQLQVLTIELSEAVVTASFDDEPTCMSPAQQGKENCLIGRKRGGEGSSKQRGG